jgi:LAS superfamily LD-carboxypeptidase LdcB
MRKVILFYRWFMWLTLAFLVCAVVYLLYVQRGVEAKLGEVTRTLEETRQTLTLSVQDTRERMEAGDQRDTTLSDLLYTEQQRIDEILKDVRGVDKTVGRLTGSVKTLEKLATTDPQLLQKYSKVYFLNEHYLPTDLEVIEEKYDVVNGKQVSVHADMWEFLHDLLDEAWEEGIELMVLSGYRSFAEQATLKENYLQRYGTGANQFSADQGYSEHQLGTAVDFTTTALGEQLNGFGSSEAYEWLQVHAHEYGFVLSYPEGNVHYTYEPWHWRFVGRDLAEYLHRKNRTFYDMEQRELDEYLPTLFD